MAKTTSDLTTVMRDLQAAMIGRFGINRTKVYPVPGQDDERRRIWVTLVDPLAPYESVMLGATLAPVLRRHGYAIVDAWEADDPESGEVVRVEVALA